MLRVEAGFVNAGSNGFKIAGC